jgi:hypothetical protein
VFVPKLSAADENGRWIVEGLEPKLESAIQELMKLLPAAPSGLPQRPAAPVKSEEQ